MKPVEISLKDKVAVITGGGRGIGKSIANLFAAAGARIAIVDIDDAEIEKAIGEVKSITSQVLGVKTDVSVQADVEAMMSKVVDKFGTVDILVNNAAIEYYVPLMRLREESWDKTFDINVKGYFLCAQAAGKIMLKKDSGSIINFASMAGYFADKYSGAYCASKAAIMQLSRALAAELAHHNVRVNCIAPGMVKTRMTDAATKDKETLERYCRIIPMGRFAEPMEMAKVALFLASDLATYVTGATITVDGGISITGMNHDESEKTIPAKYRLL
jgi:3-oxoacyl-[acyl-carrier protein] reductase